MTDAEKQELLNALSFRIEQQFCQCHKAFIDCGLVDPSCQAHDIAEYILDWDYDNGSEGEQ